MKDEGEISGEKNKGISKKKKNTKKIYLCAGFSLHDPSAALSVFPFSVTNV